MNDRVEEIYRQVMDEVCKNPLRRFAELVAADEREACAKVCETVDAAHEGDYVLAKWCAAAIRARGEK